MENAPGEKEAYENGKEKKGKFPGNGKSKMKIEESMLEETGKRVYDRQEAVGQENIGQTGGSRDTSTVTGTIDSKIRTPEAPFDMESFERDVNRKIERDSRDLERKYASPKKKGLYLPDTPEERKQLAQQRGLLETEVEDAGRELVSSRLEELIPQMGHTQMMKYVHGKERIIKYVSGCLPPSLKKKAEDRLAAKVAKQIPERIIEKWKQAAESLEYPIREYKKEQKGLRRQYLRKRFDVLLAQSSAEDIQRSIKEKEKKLDDVRKDYDTAVLEQKDHLCPRIESDLIDMESELDNKKREFISLSKNCERATVELEFIGKEKAMYSFAIAELERFRDYYEHHAWEAENLRSMDTSLAPLMEQGYLQEEKFVLDNEQDMQYLKDSIQGRLQGVTEGNLRRKRGTVKRFADVEMEKPSDTLEDSYQKAVSKMSDLRAKPKK